MTSKAMTDRFTRALSAVSRAVSWMVFYTLFSTPFSTVFSTVLSAGVLSAASPTGVTSGAEPGRVGEGAAGLETDPWVGVMAALHRGEEPVPSPAAELEPAVPVTGEEVEYAPGIRGYLARPETGTGALPGLILIHEWWGLNDNVKAMARRFAGEGYAALAVDLYGGEVATERSAAMALMGKAMADRAGGEANLRAAAGHLRGKLGAPRLGVVGWCFGGGWSLETAIFLGPELDAAVIYYGRLTTAEPRLAAISAPVLGLFGAADQGIPVSSVEVFEKTMKTLGKAVEIKVYEGAEHAFANPSGTSYQEEAATDAWQRTVRFLAAHLRSAKR